MTAAAALRLESHADLALQLMRKASKVLLIATGTVAGVYVAAELAALTVFQTVGLLDIMSFFDFG
jgi:hypothetical protein